MTVPKFTGGNIQNKQELRSRFINVFLPHSEQIVWFEWFPRPYFSNIREDLVRSFPVKWIQKKVPLISAYNTDKAWFFLNTTEQVATKLSTFCFPPLT